MLEKWRFPYVGVLDPWQHWWIGDMRNIPLQLVAKEDVRWLDKVPLDDDEQHGRTVQTCNRRWLSRKTLNDLCFLMEWMIVVVKERGKYVDLSVAIVADVNVMFNEIADEFQGIQDMQMKWNMVVQKL